MHGVYGGVMKMLLSLRFNTKLMKWSWYIGSRLHEVDEWLLMISPPSEVSKGIRSFKGKKLLERYTRIFGCEICNVFLYSFRVSILFNVLWTSLSLKYFTTMQLLQPF